MKTIKRIFPIDSIERLLFTSKIEVLYSFEIQINRRKFNTNATTSFPVLAYSQKINSLFLFFFFAHRDTSLSNVLIFNFTARLQLANEIAAYAIYRRLQSAFVKTWLPCPVSLVKTFIDFK